MPLVLWCSTRAQNADALRDRRSEDNYAPRLLWQLFSRPPIFWPARVCFGSWRGSASDPVHCRGKCGSEERTENGDDDDGGNGGWSFFVPVFSLPLLCLRRRRPNASAALACSRASFLFCTPSSWYGSVSFPSRSFSWGALGTLRIPGAVFSSSIYCCFLHFSRRLLFFFFPLVVRDSLLPFLR